MRWQAGAEEVGQRLDQHLHRHLPRYSRSRIQDWIKAGRVRVNDSPAKSSYLLRGGEQIEVEPADLPPLKATPEEIALDILYEDEAVVAVNKPAGMIVHAGAGIHSGTLTNALLHRFGELSGVGGALRPGIVHRLDRFTSGVILVARDDSAHQALARQFSSRTVEKIYLALLQGKIAREQGSITSPLARDPVHRTRMTTRIASGRSAITMYRVLRRFDRFTYVEIKIGTGRTHQIRAHFASIHHPVAGDRLYGAAVSEYGRYFLHAARITFTSPASEDRITVEAPLPVELKEWLDGLEA